jgi:hypothetical protein
MRVATKVEVEIQTLKTRAGVAITDSIRRDARWAAGIAGSPVPDEFIIGQRRRVRGTSVTRTPTKHPPESFNAGASRLSTM